MEVLITVISFILLVMLIVTPVSTIAKLNKANIKNRFITYLILGIIFTSIITPLFAWWADKSNHILLSHYGYDSDAMNEDERFANVSVENIEQVKSLEISVMGIGWTLKAIMGYVFYFPYLLLIVYLIVNLIEKYKKKRSDLDETYSKNAILSK